MEGIGIKYWRIGYRVTPLFSGVLFYNTTVSAIRSFTMLAQLIDLIEFVYDMSILLSLKNLHIQDITAMKLDELNKTITLEPELWHGTRKVFYHPPRN
jgi:hypothetical protein